MRRLAVVALVVGAACVPKAYRSAPESDWSRTLRTALAAADSGRYGDADRALADFASRFYGTPQAHETQYWRGLLMLDPANDSAALPAAIEMLDAYLAPSAAPRRHEALAARRAAAALDSLSRGAAQLVRAVDSVGHVADSLRAGVESADAREAREARDRARDDELLRLRDSLVKTSAELDRIKRRLAARRP